MLALSTLHLVLCPPRAARVAENRLIRAHTTLDAAHKEQFSKEVWQGSIYSRMRREPTQLHFLSSAFHWLGKCYARLSNVPLSLTLIPSFRLWKGLAAEATADVAGVCKV